MFRGVQGVWKTKALVQDLPGYELAEFHPLRSASLALRDLLRDVRSEARRAIRAQHGDPHGPREQTHTAAVAQPRKAPRDSVSSE